MYEVNLPDAKGHHLLVRPEGQIHLSLIVYDVFFAGKEM